MGNRGRRSWRPEWVHGLIALVLVLLGTLAGLYLFHLSPSPLHLLACWLAALNPIAFGYYGYDKWCARRAATTSTNRRETGRGTPRPVSRRVPEVVLHGLSLAGGSPGAYAAMRTFRHKTIKGRFRLVFWSIALLQLALILWLLWHLWHRHP